MFAVYQLFRSKCDIVRTQGFDCGLAGTQNRPGQGVIVASVGSGRLQRSDRGETCF